ncbi:MAG: hypothetical protein EOP45_06710 [Sphingobacteriaceae bacterium]|nr:MAG: hypothetical protein EOP45_06710 [Sphingobacteriaceae bacterium]
MKIKSKIVQGLLILLLSVSSCTRLADCENCRNDLKSIWSYKLRLPFGMELSGGELFIQDNNLSRLVILNSKTGLPKAQLPTSYNEKGDGAVVFYCINKNLIACEQALDYAKSYLKIYSRTDYKPVDSIFISLKKDLSASHGIVKLAGKPVITDSILLFVLNDGSLNAYNLSKKRFFWRQELNALPMPNSGIITTDRYVHIQLPAGAGSELITIAKENGKIVWKKHFPGQMQLSIIDNKLLSLDTHGNLVYISPNNGEFDSHSFASQEPLYYQLIQNRMIALTTKNNILIVKDLVSDNVRLRYRLCAEPVEVTYSEKVNALFLTDKAQHCLQVNLNNHQTQCIQQSVDTNESQHNFVVKGDSLYINKEGKLHLLILN